MSAGRPPAVRAGLALLARGLEWWRAELGALLPAGWRRGTSDRLIAWADAQGHHLAWSGPAGEVALPPGERPALSPVLVLSAEEGLIRRLDLPALPLADLRRLVGLDLDRLTPFLPALALADVVVEASAGDRVRVAVGVVRRDHARAALARAAEAGLRPAALALRDETGQARFDFLPALSAAERPARRGWAQVRPGMLWGGAGGLALVTLGAMSWRDEAGLDALRQRLDAARPAVTAARALRDSTAAETDRRARLRARQREADPLTLLAALTAALPDGAWVQRLEWDGSGLRLAGWAQGGEAGILAALAAVPAFQSARAEAPTLAAQPGRQPFALVIERVGRLDAGPEGR